MPKRKISIEDAFAALEQAGIHVQVKQVDPVQQSVQQQPVQSAHSNMDYTQYPPVLKQQQLQRVGKGAVRIPLYSSHSVSCGGYIAAAADGSKQVQEAGVVTYGPGYCTVPADLVEHLLYQDRLAKLADERMLEKTARKYIVGEVCSMDGSVANIGCLVDDAVFDDVSKWPTMLIRGNS
jgi:hypothetical protein